MKTTETYSRYTCRQSAFTRIDLVVVALTVTFLAAMILPALARTHVRMSGTQCAYDLRQIILAWQMYADDSNGKMAPNHGAYPPNPDYGPTAGELPARWVGGSMAGNVPIGSPYSVNDPVNLELLVNSYYSCLVPYLKDPKLYRCPADMSTWIQSGGDSAENPASNNGKEVVRVRSYSMNAAVGCAYNGTRQDPGHDMLGHWLTAGTSPGPWQTYIKNSDLTGALAPSSLFVLIEEHPNSINDACFDVYAPTSPFDGNMRFIDTPGANHDGTSCGISFADGHAEMHKWNNPGAIPKPVWAADESASLGNGGTPPAGPNSDMLWLAKHTSFNTQISGWPGY